MARPLECAAYAKAKDTLFLVKEERKPVNDLVLTGVGIIGINEAKRHVENRYLKTNLSAQAAANVTEIREEALP